MATTVKKQMFVTPKGVARFPWLTVPDTRFDKEGKYKIDLVLDLEDEAAAQFVDALSQENKAHWDEVAKKDKSKAAASKSPHDPFKPDIDRSTGDETGKIVVKFSSQFPPTLWDAARQKITGDIKVGGGSEVRVAFVKNFYYNAKDKECGMNLYLQQVQIIKLVEYGSQSVAAEGFDDEGDGFHADQPPPEEFGDKQGEEAEDHIPGLGPEDGKKDEPTDDPVYADIDAALADDKKLNLADRCAKAGLGYEELKPILLDAKKNPVMFRIKLNTVLKSKGA